MEMHGGQIARVSSNLMGNAIHALPISGSLHVRIHRSRDRVRSAVADCGDDIPAKQVPHVYRPFFTTKGKGGAGLGLAMSQSILADDHGWIRLRSSLKKAAAARS